MPETDKTYVKKYKINDMLNDLFTAISQNKPENPLEFAIKHLESKLPAKSESNEEKLKKNSNLESVTPATQGAPPVDDGTELLMKMMSKKKLHGENEIVASSATTGGDELLEKIFKSRPVVEGPNLSPFIRLGILNKMNKIVVKTNKEKTPEEMLESENIVVIQKNRDQIEDEDKDKKIVTSYSKDKLKSREAYLKRKQTIQNIIESNEQRLLAISASQENKLDFGRQLDFDGLKENELEELNEEILTASNYNSAKERRKKKNEERKNISQRANLNQSQFNTRARMASPAPPPAVQLIICQFCSKAQNQLNKSENTLLNEPNNTERLASNAQAVIPPLDVTPLENKPDKDPSNLVEKEDDTKKTIFDFFKAIKSSDKLPEFSQDTQRTQKTETFDDDNIESASQVSGPRPIAPYDPPTSRTNLKELDSERDLPKEPGVLGWVMTRQRLDEKEAASRNQSFEKTGTTQQPSTSSIGSPRSKTGEKVKSPTASQISRTSTTKRPGSETVRKQDSNASNASSTQQQQQHWKGKDTSSESSVHYKKA